MTRRFPKLAALKTPARLRAHVATLGIALPVDDEVLAAPGSPLAEALDLEAGDVRVALTNRFVVQPMEGWDAGTDGRPSPLTERRWRRFGRSGAAWVWGGEAVAVQADGRANPNQLVLTDDTAASIGGLRAVLLEEAERAGLPAPFVGLQLTHSGRWSRPTAAGPVPRVAYRHSILDRRVGVEDDAAVLSDAELDALVGRYARAAALAQSEGFGFVDLKHCHGYLLHEVLSARKRRGRFGGPALADRLRLADAMLDAIRTAAPGLAVGVRLSVFDRVPHRPVSGEPEPFTAPYREGFGVDPRDPRETGWDEPLALVRHLVERGVRWLNVTAGSPYYVPHVQRPAAFPPSDGYAPPEDPLRGVVRLLDAARRVKAAAPQAVVVSSGWSYLQDFVPHVAQACVRAGWFDAVGLGRMVLSYPELPADVLAGRPLRRGLVCRTFSDCTSAPRQGMVSGCYPLDDFYRERPERERLEALKREAKVAAS